MNNASVVGMTGASKKRTLGEITKSNASGSGGQNKAAGQPQDPNTRWIEKDAPNTIEELVINKKKVKEFIDIAEDNTGGGFLVL